MSETFKIDDVTRGGPPDPVNFFVVTACRPRTLRSMSS